MATGAQHIDATIDLQKIYIEAVQHPVFSTWAGPTVSPHWQQTLSETILVMCVLACFDLSGVRKSPARYFILHALINAGVVVIVYKDFIDVFLNPIDGDQRVEHSCLPLVWAIHLYHVLFFKGLTMVDWMHHLINVLIMGVIAECWFWGKGVNATCFIMNGVPGGLDYVFLTLMKHGLMSSSTEKTLNSYLNIMVRLPGMTIIGYDMILAKYHGRLPNNPWWVVTIVMILEWGNAVYFCQRVVGNWHVSDYKKSIASSTKKTA